MELKAQDGDIYYTIEKIETAEIKIKGSKFIGTAAHTPTKESAMEFLTLMRSQYFDATHNCYAYKIGWNGIHSTKTERADLVGHAWFFRQEWSKYIWYEKPYMWDNGEDIMFSFLAQKYGNISTFVPKHPENEKNLWSSDFKLGVEIGNDKNASWLKGGHYGERDRICEYCINNGWKTVNNIK